MAHNPCIRQQITACLITCNHLRETKQWQEYRINCEWLKRLLAYRHMTTDCILQDLFLRDVIREEHGA